MSNSSASSLHESLLRPAILQILRAAGFHATRPSVLDTLTDLAARHLLLLASKTAANASVIHNDLIPCITDVRLALQDSGVIVAPLTAAEETWREMLRKPLDQYPERNGLRAKERARRDAEDTADVREFLDWITGEKNREIRRAAGMFNDEVQGVELEATGQTEDYLTGMLLYPWRMAMGERARRPSETVFRSADVLFSSSQKETQQNRRGITISGDSAWEAS